MAADGSWAKAEVMATARVAREAIMFLIERTVTTVTRITRAVMALMGADGADGR